MADLQSDKYLAWRAELEATVPESEPLPPDWQGHLRERVRIYADEWEARRDEEYRKRRGRGW